MSKKKKFHSIVLGIFCAFVLVFGFIIYDDTNANFIDEINIINKNDSISSLNNANQPGGIVIDEDFTAHLYSDDTLNSTPSADVNIYFDYMCPFCSSLESYAAPALKEEIRTGKIRLILHPLAILNRTSNGTNYSTRAASASYFIANKAPHRFYSFYLLLFANQPKEGSNGLSDNDIEKLALKAGVEKSIAHSIRNYSDFNHVNNVTNHIMSNSKLNNVTGVPRVFITKPDSPYNLSFSVGKNLEEIDMAFAASDSGDMSGYNAHMSKLSSVAYWDNLIDSLK